MADGDIPPPPDGYFDDPAAARMYYQLHPPSAAPAAPAPTPSDVPPPPPGYYATPTEGRAGGDPSTVYRGSILPFSQDAAGKTHFDLGAGLPGSLYNTLKSTVMAPGEVLGGELPTPYSPGTGTTAPDPGVMQRAADFAMNFSPTSTAARAGAMAPGMGFRFTPPTAPELKRAAQAGYDQVLNSGLDFSRDATNGLVGSINDALAAKTILPESAPQVLGAVNTLKRAQPQLPAMYGPAPVGIADIQSTREALGRIASRGGEEAIAANIAKNKIDDFLMGATPSDLSPTTSFAGNPQDVAQTLRDAGRNYAAAQRSNDITGSLDRAVTGISERADMQAQASASGNLDNAIRSRVRTFISNPDNVAGLTDQQLGMLRQIAEGSTIRDALRSTGTAISRLGHGTGAIAGGITGAAGGEPWLGMAAGALIPPWVGGLLTGGADRLSQAALNRVDEVIRSGSPLASQYRNIVPRPTFNNSLYRGGLIDQRLQPPPPTRPLTEQDLAGRA